MSQDSIVPRYPDELPVSGFRAAILDALRTHQVIIVAGDTGSGKTTQLPKMLIEALDASARRAADTRCRRIVCTQPRRLAAVAMAERVAAEFQDEPGHLIGYRHRFGSCVSRETRVIFATDGILLAETRRDPLLKAYDAIMVDEAHERSLNIDFLLGILKRILTRRRDLRVVISSATLDTERFAEFFAGAAVIHVPGRLFPVGVRYLPPPPDEERDLPAEIGAALRTLPCAGDVLVFLSGERDILDTRRYLEGAFPSDEIIPLLASLPAAEQRRAFRLSTKRRVILATNVAETSVTIPGIRHVIDSGMARIARYIHRTGIQRLQIENVSKASCTQRAGRCGRLGPGICLRLYSREDFEAREDFTPPEILRSSLAGVILTMLDLRLGDIAQFPFLNPPRPAMISEGVRELLELGAIARDATERVILTPLGKQLVRFPVEPRFARMLLSASEWAVLPSVLPVVAAMACEDPRRRPADEREKAAQAHAAFRVAGSDFLGMLKLWRWWEMSTQDLSQSKARALAKKTYLSYPKMREWRDVMRQLFALAKALKLDVEHDNGGEDAFHRALLTGLLSRLGHYNEETHDYRGPHGLRFTVHPGSVLSRVKVLPPWIVAGELVDTARLFARQSAVIDPSWIESAAKHLVKCSYRAPEYDPASGFVRAIEQVTLYGLVIVPGRRCDYSRIDLMAAREIFIREALVEGAFPRPPPIIRSNNALIEDLRSYAVKCRHPEYFDTEKLCAHFARHLPADICSADALRRHVDSLPKEFLLKREDWFPDEDADLEHDFPDVIQIGGAKMRLTYASSDEADAGIICTVRKCDAAAIQLWRSDWLVPGLLPEKLTWMLNVLPSALRRVLPPVSEVVSMLLSNLKPGTMPLADAVREAIYKDTAIRIPPDAWEHAKIPAHLTISFRIVDDNDTACAACPPYRERDAATNAPSLATDWTFGDVPEVTSDSSAGWSLPLYPALVDCGSGVKRQLFRDAAMAARVHEGGVMRLFTLACDTYRLPIRMKELSPFAAECLKFLTAKSDDLATQLFRAAIRAAFVRGRPAVRTAAEFQARLHGEEPSVLSKVQAEFRGLLLQAYDRAGRIIVRLDESEFLDETTAEVHTQLSWLLPPVVVGQMTAENVRALERYLKAIEIRLDRARVSPSSDRTKAERFNPYWEWYRETVLSRKVPADRMDDLMAYRWMLEEYRVSIFAQELGTAQPVSPKRLSALQERISHSTF